MNRRIVGLIVSFSCSFALFASGNNPASQSWVRAHFVAQNTPISWSSLCQTGQQLLGPSGCTPDCRRTSMAGVCSQLFTASGIAKLSFISEPYDSQGVFVFQINTEHETTGSSFNLLISQPPATGKGYACEIVYQDGSPVTLWDTNNNLGTGPNLIAMDSTCSETPCVSDNYTNFKVAPQTYYWYNNPKIPLYMLCLAYTEQGAAPTQLQSSSGCSGTDNTQACVSYRL